MRFILLVALLFTGCGSDITNPLDPDRIEHEPKIDLGPFSSYVDAFLNDAYNNGSRVSISDLVVRFKDIPKEDETKTILGRCWLSSTESPTIDIDPEEWERLGPTSKHLLMYHEMGHCVLKRDHFDDGDSIMNTYLLSSVKFEKNKEAILAELFDESKYNSFGYLHLTPDHGPICEGHHQ